MQYRYQLGTVTLVNIEELNAAVAEATETASQFWRAAYIVALNQSISVHEFNRINTIALAAMNDADSVSGKIQAQIKAINHAFDSMSY
jgi:hypothetical protein